MWKIAAIIALGLAAPALAGEPEIDWKGRDGVEVRLSVPGRVEAQSVRLVVSFAATGGTPEAATAALRAARDGFLAALAAAGHAGVPFAETEAEVKPARGEGFEGSLEAEVELPLGADLFETLMVVVSGNPSGYRLAGYGHPDYAAAVEQLKAGALEQARAAAAEAAAADGRTLGELRAVTFDAPAEGSGRRLDFEITLEAEFAAPKP